MQPSFKSSLMFDLMLFFKMYEYIGVLDCNLTKKASLIHRIGLWEIIKCIFHYILTFTNKSTTQ